MHRYICIYEHACIDMYRGINTFGYVWIEECIYMCVSPCVHRDILVYIDTEVCIYVCVSGDTYLYIHVLRNVYACVYMCVEPYTFVYMCIEVYLLIEVYMLVYMWFYEYMCAFSHFQQENAPWAARSIPEMPIYFRDRVPKRGEGRGVTRGQRTSVAEPLGTTRGTIPSPCPRGSMLSTQKCPILTQFAHIITPSTSNK